jgi:hypothetical protein
VPVNHTVDKEGNCINKLSCRDFWRGQNSYRVLQDTFFKHIKEKGFNLERGIASEETGAENLPMEVLKKVTNYENTVKILRETTLDMPKTPDLEEFARFTFNRDEKIKEKIIKPRDDLIKDLHSELVKLHANLSKQANIIDKATKFEKEYTSIIVNNQELQEKCDKMENEFDKKVEQVENKYDIQANNLQMQFSNDTKKLKSDYENELYNVEQKSKKKYRELEKQNNLLHKVITTLQNTLERVFLWVANKVLNKTVDKEDLKAEFEYDTYTSLDVDKQMARLDRENEHDEMEL